jgi:asparagine synthase (glutamine-hydrolysing)
MIMAFRFDNFETVLTESKPLLDRYPANVKDDKTYEDHVRALDRLLRKATVKRNQYEVPWGVALSGGLDSNYVGFLKRNTEIIPFEEAEDSDYPHRGGFHATHTFSIGLNTSNDLKIAKEYACSPMMQAYHHEIMVNVDEALSCVEDVIWTIETYDVTTVRASVMNYLLAKYMKRYGIKVVYSGEGSDELYGGYLYFHNCPNKEEMHLELKRKMEQLHYYDCLRANKCFAAFGIECRLIFLDKDVVEYSMNIDPVHKLSGTHPDGPKQEKHLLRAAFEHAAQNLFMMDEFCPERDKFIYRQKDQFSDSVGKEWIEALKNHSEKCVTDEQMLNADKKFTIQTPSTKEAYYYREIFEKLFLCSGENFVRYDPTSVACSTSTGASWCSVTADPSAVDMKKALS